MQIFPLQVLDTMCRVWLPAAGACALRGPHRSFVGLDRSPRTTFSSPRRPHTRPPLSPHPRIGSARPWGHRTLARRWLGTSDTLSPLSGARPRLAHIGLSGAVLPVSSAGPRTPLSLPAPVLEGCSELQKKNKNLKLKLCGKAAREATLRGTPLGDGK